MGIPVSLQLYTIRREMEKDFIASLEKVAEIGYKGVEFAGYGGLSASELRKHLDRLGLSASGSHVGLDALRNNLSEMIDYNLEIGSNHIICPWAVFNSRAELLELADFLNKTGRKCRSAGLELCYHNHDHEFKIIDDSYGLDILYGETDPEYLKLELDTYWVKRAEVDPIDYMKKYGERCLLVHLKDMEADKEKFYAEIGNGIMDIAGIVKTAGDINSKWLVVEQDECRRPPFESIKISYDNLKKMGLIK